MERAERNPGLQRGVDIVPDFAASIRTTFASPALVAGNHVFTAWVKPKTWVAGTSPAMTVGGAWRHVHSS